MTGAWFGRYAYADGQPPVAFLATVDEGDGGFSGWTSEVNTVGDSSPYLNAVLAGERQGRTVAFSKTYDGASDVAHAVEYAGRLDATGELLTGAWRFAGGTGVFEMRRTHADGEEDEVERREAIDART